MVTLIALVSRLGEKSAWSVTWRRVTRSEREGEAVGIGFVRGVAHELSDSIVGEQQRPDLLADHLW